MPSSYYILDHEDRIVQVGGNWDSAAMANDAETVLSTRIIGRSVWSGIHGEPMRSFLNAIFFGVRRWEITARLKPNNGLRSPTLSTEMVVSPEPQGGLRVTHHYSPNGATALVPVSDPAQPDLRCGFCGSIMARDPLLDLPAPNRNGQYEGICRNCRSSAQAALIKGRVERQMSLVQKISNA